MSSFVKIVRAGEEHVPAIVDLWKRLSDYQTAFDLVHRLRDDAGIGFQRYVRSKLLSEEDLFLVAVIGDSVVGFSMSAVSKGRPDVYERASFVEISDMFVLEEYRRRGIATQMLNHVRRWVESKGIRRIELHVEARNSIGLAFWKKQGFKDYIYRLHLNC